MVFAVTYVANIYSGNWVEIRNSLISQPHCIYAYIFTVFYQVFFINYIKILKMADIPSPSLKIPEYLKMQIFDNFTSLTSEHIMFLNHSLISLINVCVLWKP